MKNSFLLLFFLIFLSSCHKRNKDFNVIETSSDFDFHSIELFDGVLYATGGDVWSMSNIVQSTDGGNQWTVDSLCNKSIFDLYEDGAFLYGVGVDGYIFRGDPDLTLFRTKHWDMLRGFTRTSTGSVAVGGKDFNKGWIYKINEALKTIDTTFAYDHELQDVAYGDDGVLVAVGFGIILQSHDEGLSWSKSNVTGDFYTSVAFNNDGVPFVVGNKGSIIYSDDKGESWSTIEGGHSPIGRNTSFRSVKFFGEMGFAVGERGSIWMTSNSGNQWTDISIATDLDLFDFEYLNDALIVVSENGNIIVVSI